MAIPLEYFCKQLSELQKNDPDRFIRSLVALNDVGALEAISNVMYDNGGALRLLSGPQRPICGRSTMDDGSDALFCWQPRKPRRAMT